MTLHTGAAGPRTGRQADRRIARQQRLVGLGAAVATLLLLAGPPTALSVAVGWPLPQQLPTMPELRTFLLSPTSDETVLKVLATFGWLLWAQLAGAVLLELTARLRGLTAPRLPLMTLNQHLAQRLISATLLLLPTSQPLLAGDPLPAYTRAVAATPYPTDARVLAPAASEIRVTAVQLEQPGATESTSVSVLASESAPPDIEDAAVPEISAAPIVPTATQPVRARPAALKQYIVQPPHDRHHDSLWAIAARHLGDGRRFPEIFALNHGRPQPDGRTLTKPSFIQPGWILLLPADATGPDLQPVTPTPDNRPDVHGPVAPAEPSVAAPSQPQQLAAPVPSQAPHLSAEQRPRPPQEAAHDAARQPEQTNHESENLLEHLGLGLGAIAALAALTRARKAAQRRRPQGRRLPPPPAELRPVETALRREAQHHAALTGEVRAACALAAATTPQAAHQLMTAVLQHDDQRLEILTDPTGTAVAPPVPFTATDRGWQLAATDRGFLPAADSHPDPMPVLLPVGRLDPSRHDDRAQLYVDLTRLGLISLDGPEPDCDASCLTAAGELAGAPWAGLTRILVPTALASQLGDLERLEPVSDLADRVPQLLTYASTARLAGHDEAAADAPDADVVTDDASGSEPAGNDVRAGDCTLRMVLIGWDAAQLPDALIDAALDPQQPVIILTTTPHPRATETWSLQDGQLRHVLGHWQLEPRPRSPHASDLPTLLRQPSAPDLPTDHPDLQVLREDSPPQPPAAAPPAEPNDTTSTTATTTANPGAPDAPASSDGTVDPIRAAAADPQPTRPAPRSVEIGILGPVQLTGAEPPRRVPVLQILVYLAVHRRGATAEQVATALWPDTRVASQTLRNRVAEARALVGGQISEGPGWRLHPSVTCDWQRFQQLAAGDTLSQQQALELVRGLPLQDFPDAEWIDTEGLRSHIEAAIVDLALQVGEHALAEAQPGRAFWAARTGLRASPYEERLFRLAMRAADAEGATGKVRALMRELRTVLDLELEPDDTIQPETLSLYRELLNQPRPPTD